MRINEDKLRTALYYIQVTESMRKRTNWPTPKDILEIRTSVGYEMVVEAIKEDTYVLPSLQTQKTQLDART